LIDVCAVWTIRFASNDLQPYTGCTAGVRASSDCWRRWFLTRGRVTKESQQIHNRISNSDFRFSDSVFDKLSFFFSAKKKGPELTVQMQRNEPKLKTTTILVPVYYSLISSGSMVYPPARRRKSWVVDGAKDAMRTLGDVPKRL